MKQAFLLLIITFCSGHKCHLYGQEDGPQLTVESFGLNDKVRSMILVIGDSVRSSVFKKVTFTESGFIDSTFSQNADKGFVLNYHSYWKGDTMISISTPAHLPREKWSKVLFDKQQLPVYQITGGFGFEKEGPEESWWQYDQQNRLINYQWKNKNKKSKKTLIYKVTSDTTIIVVSNSFERGYRQIINQSFKKIFESFYNKEHTRRWEHTFSYDKLGNFQSAEHCGFNKVGETWVKMPIINKYEKVFKYDLHDNWIESKYYENGKLASIITRIIYYW